MTHAHRTTGALSTAQPAIAQAPTSPARTRTEAPRPEQAARPRQTLTRRRVLGMLACAACTGALACLSGCSATTVDVYATCAQATYTATGSLAEETRYTLDERGNAIETTRYIGGDNEPRSASTCSYDVYGVPQPAGLSCSIELDDKGQPTKISYTEPEATEPSTVRTIGYTDVTGRISSDALVSADLTYSLSYDRDGWPLGGTVRVGDDDVEVAFVYEITDTGAVTAQHATTGGETIATYTYEYNEEMRVSVRHNPDGSSTAYTYRLIEDPTAYAMMQALTYEPDFAGIVAALEA